MRDLASIGDTVSISATKDGIKFSTSGDVGTANITLRWDSAAGGLLYGGAEVEVGRCLDLRAGAAQQECGRVTSSLRRPGWRGSRQHSLQVVVEAKKSLLEQRSCVVTWTSDAVLADAV